MTFEELQLQKLPKRFKGERIHILCVMQLPDEVRDRMARADVQRCHGRFLLGFNFPPTVGEVYPYQGQLWELVKPPLQFPHRYGSKEEKQAAIALFKWVGSYESLDGLVEGYLQWTQD